MSLELASQKKENYVYAVLRALPQQNSAHTLYFNLCFWRCLNSEAIQVSLKLLASILALPVTLCSLWTGVGRGGGSDVFVNTKFRLPR